MYIGLYDADLMFAPTSFKLNLEIMKMASYFKKRGDTVEFLLNLQNTEKYDIIYIRKDSEKTVLDNSIFLKKNIEWGGLAFTNGEYIPMEPIDIEYAIPNVSIYSKYFKMMLSSGELKEDKYKTMLNANYIRLCFNGEIAKMDYIEKSRTAVVYDTHLTEQPNWSEALCELGSRLNKNRKISFVRPIVFKTIDENFDLFIKNDKLKVTDTKMIFDIDFKPVEFKKFIAKYANELVKFKSRKNIYFIFGRNNYSHSSEEFYRKEILNVLNGYLLCCSKSLNVAFKYYDEGYYNELHCLCKRIDAMTSHPASEHFSLYEYCKRQNGRKEINLMDEIIKKHNPKYEIVFKAIPLIIKQGGYWIYD